MVVDIEEVEAMYARIAEINAVQFDDILWLRNGSPVEISADNREEWKFIGLSNFTFPDFHGDFVKQDS